MKKTFFVLLVAVFILSFGVNSAFAAWGTGGFTTAKKVLPYSNATTLKTQSAATDIFYSLGTGEALASNDTITITLTGGALFSTTTPGMSPSGGNASTGFSIVGNPAGTATANFTVKDTYAAGSTIFLNSASDTIFDVSAVTGNVDVQFKATQTSAGGLTIFDRLASTGTAGTNAYAFSKASAMESVYLAAQTNTADVSASTGAYTKFTGATTTGTATNADFTNLCEAANTAPLGQEISANKIVWGITGTLDGITQIASTANITGSTSAGVTTGGTANKFLINTEKTEAYAANTAALAPAGNIVVNPTFTLDGTTAQMARSFNVAVSMLADGTKWAAHTALASSTLYSIVRNGTTFATNSIGPRNSIKITDRSNGLPTTGGVITITAWDADGVSIPESSSAAGLTVQNNATTTITGTELAARFPTGTPMKYEFAVESANAVISNVKDSTDGVVRSTTVYTSGTGAI